MRRRTPKSLRRIVGRMCRRGARNRPEGMTVKEFWKKAEKEFFEALTNDTETQSPREIGFTLYETPAPIETRIIDGKEKIVSPMPDGSVWVVCHNPEALLEVVFGES